MNVGFLNGFQKTTLISGPVTLTGNLFLSNPMTGSAGAANNTFLTMPDQPFSQVATGFVNGTTWGGAFEKQGWFGTTPATKPGATTDLGVVLSTLGFRITGTAYPITTSGAVTLTGAVAMNATTLATDTTTGLKIGTAVGQKLGFWNVTPIVQPASANQAAVGTTAPAGGTGAAAGGWDTSGHRDTAITTINSLVTLVNQMRSDLVAAGILKGSA